MVNRAPMRTLPARRHEQPGDVAATGHVGRWLRFTRLECDSIGQANLMTPPV
jgi:hypothetical protein